MLGSLNFSGKGSLLIASERHLVPTGLSNDETNGKPDPVIGALPITPASGCPPATPKAGFALAARRALELLTIACATDSAPADSELASADDVPNVEAAAPGDLDSAVRS